MGFTALANRIFNACIGDYHKTDDVHAQLRNPYREGTIEHLLYLKNGIDTLQWHLEDRIRDPDIPAEEALQIKRRIDELNQQRTDTVECIDYWFSQKYAAVIPDKDAKINTESPAWAVDRLSISALKIYHMRIEATREGASENHKRRAREKLAVLLAQRRDLCQSIEELLADLGTGKKITKVYKQMKMYNDAALNPVLYSRKSAGCKNTPK